MQADFLEVERCAYGFSGEVAAADLLRLADGVIQRTAGGGLRLRVNGAVELDRTSVSGNTPWGIGVEGSGMLRLRDVVVDDNGWEGIYLGNCSLEATNTHIMGNGELDPEDPRPGLLAVGGRGQKIDLRACAVEGNALDGLELSGWEGEAQLYDSSISGNKRQGLRAAGLERLVLEGVRVERNLEIGASVEAAPVEVCSSTFADNIGTGLVLGAGVSGQVDGSLFRSNDGLRLHRVDDLVVRQSAFENAAVGLYSESSRPTLIGNTFSRNLTAIRVSGFAVPDSVSGNVFVGNPTAAENLSVRRLPAEGNYWGTVDTLAIAAAIKGDVDWRPFLTEEPDPTAGGEPAAETPDRFILYPAYPNPFNARTTIPLDVAEAAHVELTVWDLLGRPVRRLAGSRFEPGSYSRVWDGLDRDRRPAATGVYFVHLRAGGFEQTNRLLLLR